MLAIGNDELGEDVGDTAKCLNCGKEHKVKYGKRVLEDGSKMPSKSLGYVSCREKSFLVSLMGKLLKK